MGTLPCTIIRGGTSKGVFLREEHLPADPEERDRLLLALMGSPDPRQVDGLGGADPLTSKVAIVSPSQRADADVEYESVEVGIAEARVNHGLMCGNLIAGVGYFAMAEGLIQPRAPSTLVRIYCRSNHKLVTARIPWQATTLPTDAGAVLTASGEARVDLFFRDPGGTLTDRLLPAGEPCISLELGDREVECSIVDAGTLYAFLRAEDFGLRGDESAAVLDARTEFRAAVEILRQQVAYRINQHSFFGAEVLAPRLVKMAIVAPLQAPGGEVDVLARVINPAKVHKAYAVSGGICLAAAAAIPGTLVHRLTGDLPSPFLLRIGHPSGVLSLGTYWSWSEQGGQPGAQTTSQPTVFIQAAEIQRTARILMRGTAYLPGQPEDAVATAAEAPLEAQAARV